jgi:hypothetical protein
MDQKTEDDWTGLKVLEKSVPESPEQSAAERDFRLRTRGAEAPLQVAHWQKDPVEALSSRFLVPTDLKTEQKTIDQK